MGLLLVEQLLARGDRVTTLNRGTLPDPFGDRIERLQGDRSRGAVPRLVGRRSFDACVDFAAYEARDLEGLTALDLGHYVFISTGQVYLVREGCPRPSREEDYEGPLVPRPAAPEDQSEWDYGVGKRACEDLLAAAKTFPSTRVRIPVVNGAGDLSGRLESYLFRIRDREPLILPDGGAHRVRHTYAPDVVRAVSALLGDARTHGRAYNLANDETPTLAELVAILARLLGEPPRTASIPAARLLAAGLVPRRISPFSSAWQSFLDPSRARRELGFVATPLEEQMRVIVNSFLACAPRTSPEGYATRREEVRLAKELAPPETHEASPPAASSPAPPVT